MPPPPAWNRVNNIFQATFDSLEERKYLDLNPTPCGGGGIYAPPTTFRQFSPDVLIRGGSNYTLNLSFVITEHLNLVSGQKNFPTARGRPPKSGG